MRLFVDEPCQAPGGCEGGSGLASVSYAGCRHSLGVPRGCPSSGYSSSRLCSFHVLLRDAAGRAKPRRLLQQQLGAFCLLLTLPSFKPPPPRHLRWLGIGQCLCLSIWGTKPSCRARQRMDLKIRFRSTFFFFLRVLISNNTNKIPIRIREK